MDFKEPTLFIGYPRVGQTCSNENISLSSIFEPPALAANVARLDTSWCRSNINGQFQRIIADLFSKAPCLNGPQSHRCRGRGVILRGTNQR